MTISARSPRPTDVDPGSEADSPIRVLLVDDEPAIARSLGRLLTDAGNQVTTARDGAEGFKLVESTRFDVIISDIRMPGLDGLGLLRAVRGRDLDVPVVFMTASPDLQTAIQAVEHGAFRYLLKPFDGRELVALAARAGRLHRMVLLSRQATEVLAGNLEGDRKDLETRFGLALDGIRMAMQPILSWHTRTVFGYEALLRTSEPTLQNPVDFVDAAVRLNRTAELGRRIRRKIADQLVAAPPHINLFVNLHPSDLVDDELSADDGALTGFAHRVVLEVTERAGLDQVAGISSALVRLRALGFRIALDDLGAGYAGLCSFAQLEPEIVKIDISLVRGIHESPVKQKLFRSFTSLCREMSTEIVAEGVELVEERDCLNELGGDLYQGFLFARPGPGFPPPVF
jgi:EAL domain-containing protein (putative c-di-GMP-specific phosphodiesterase class I)/CheY-like chemotaxis protein